jgi:hypothetical protein
VPALRRRGLDQELRPGLVASLFSDERHVCEWLS